MRIVIRISETEDFKTSKANSQISDICKYVGADGDRLVLTAQPGRLMDLLRTLNENDIAYHVQDLSVGT